MADASGGSAFGQQVPPLSIYLKKVLEKYPEGGQILKELVQNADDAKASQVVFMYDKSEHSCEGLWSDKLVSFQGPALYAYNDAIFEAADWDNIQKPEQSGKADDVVKVGRFGLGFISVYHLTDLPSVLSGDNIGFLDPLEENFNFDPRTKTTYVGRRGMQWKTSAKLLNDFPGQFSPYLLDLFKCNATDFQNGKFQGTIFRFPLRKQQSEISKSVFNDEHRVYELLQSFQTDAEISLLFLKHVESIAVYERCGRLKQPRIIFRVQIPPKDRTQVNSDRLAFLDKIRDNEDAYSVSCMPVEKQLGPENKTSVNKYVTVNALKRDSLNTSEELQNLIDDNELKLLPWMGAAFKVNLEANIEQDGRVFCFLPLPKSEQTGLPVHVHGYFGLGDNRRSIKWPDQESRYDKKALWNQLLVNEVFPEIYAKLFLAIIAKSKTKTYQMQAKDVYMAWPCIEDIKKEWSNGIKQFVQLLGNEAIFYTHHNGGCWMKSTEVYVDTQNTTLISKSFGHCINRRPVAQLPSHVVESLKWAGVDYQEVTPEIVRSSIRGGELQFLTRDEKLKLLQYVTSDTISDLSNLELLPLQNDTFTFFCETSSKVYIASYENPRAIIPNGENRFAASDLPDRLTDPEVESYTQIQILSSDDVEPLLRETLPVAWIKGKDIRLKWTPGRSQHPVREWLTNMWEWLTKNQIPLSTFQGIPLIPMANNNNIVRLQKNTMIFLRQQRLHVCAPDVCLTDNVGSFLEKLGAVVIRDDLPSCIINHPHIDSFIQAPTPDGVMTILESFNPKVDLHNCVKDLSTNSKDEIRCLLAELKLKLNSEQKDILRQLPFFLYRASDDKYTSAVYCKAAVPSDHFQIPVKRLKFGRLIIRDDSDKLALSLGVDEESDDTFLSENILPAVEANFYDHSTKLKIITWVFEKQKHDLVRKLKFIPTADKHTAAIPSELFEPTERLQVLLGQRNVFPSGVYSEELILRNLKRVGLKNESDISKSDVLDAANELSISQESGHADIKRGTFLLEHINRYPDLLSEMVTSRMVTKPLCKFLEDLCWVPCEASRSSQYPMSARWFGDANTLHSPRRVGLIDTSLLQGSMLPLINLKDTNDKLLDAFSWNTQLDPNNYQHVERVVQHLNHVARNFDLTKDDAGLISITVSAIYTFLNQTSDKDLKHVIGKHINVSQPWVWHGSGFTTHDKIALDIGTLGVSLVPYLHIVPSEHKQKYEHLLSKMRVQQTFQECELGTVLLNVQQKHQVEDVHQVSTKEYQQDLNLVSNILKYIVNLDNFDCQKSEILVPCRTSKGSKRILKMVQASECLFVDEERLAKQLFVEGCKEDFDKPVIHESISNNMAERLGLQPLSHFIAPVEKLEYGYDMAGPSETTVNAIKRNLDMYKKVDIFKELIQNADDAGATEVKFLIDWRRNKGTANNLLCDGMKACHGPAVWAFNNARFSEMDIINICSIAAQSKKNKLDKVGRFGLGFTSVYHLTDVPSVVSGPYVLICDPRTTHLGNRILPRQPGIKLDLTNKEHRRTLELYPNQFQPYNGIFDCKLDESTTDFKHTLFRLPLRTVDEVNDRQPNQLSDCSYDSKEKIDPLIDSLKQSSETLLLFTQNVVHVSVFELQSENIKDMKTVLSVRISKVPDIQMPRSISGPQENMMTERNLLKATALSMNSKSPSRPETTMIVKVTRETCSSKKGSQNKLNKAEKHFIISSCMAGGEIEELASTQEGNKAGVLPCGGVAAELVYGKGGLTPQPTKGKAFSYLPLDVATGLPFHVNGNFLLQPNRRQLWSKPSSSTGEFEAQWNNCFMKAVLYQALLNLLTDLQTLQEQNVDARDFQSLWPVWEKCHNDFRPLVDEYYRNVGRENDAPTVIFNGTHWVSVQNCFFTDSSAPMDLRGSIIAMLNNHQSPKRWVELHKDVVSSIEKVGANQFFDKNTFSVDRFLQEVYFPTLQKEENVEPNHRDKINLHVLDLRLGERKVTKYDGILKTTVCIPTSPEGEELVRPEQLVNPCTDIGSLYSEDDNRFPHGKEYRSEDRLLSLTNLGMASHDLSWEDICERAASMLQDRNTEKKSKILLKLIDEKLRKRDEPTLEQRRRIQEAQFLHVLTRPESYPSEWYKWNVEFTSAASLYECKHIYLLGSVQPLLDEEILGSEALSKKIKTFLGFKDKIVKVGDVVRQLDILINQSSHDVQQTTSMVFEVYSFLQNEICTVGTDDKVEVREEHRAAFDKLRTLRFVLCKGQFRECREIAFCFCGDCGSYLFRVPDLLSRYKKLLQICGVRHAFKKEDYIQTLQSLKTKYKDDPLINVDLKTAKVMMSEISALVNSHDKPKDDKEETNPDDEQLLVLDDHNILRSPKELTYNDMNWEEHEEFAKSVVYTHQDISHHNAKAFGIKTARERQLESCSSFSGFEMDFSQKEKLTDRLHNILTAYSNVSDVFKELLQNADDAGSTEIHFVYDPRSHEGEKVISDLWASAQRLPALCVYNNRSFTEDDIAGIQKVGVGGKRDDVTTTGRFGIGFNAVYHLTDFPSFLSNKEKLCVFDPLLKCIPGATERSPGKMFSTNVQFRQRFPDMLCGYLEDIEEFSGEEGTMFRFPLRKEYSVISRNVFCALTVKRILDDFKMVAVETLLFLNNIKKISISRMNTETNKLETEHVARATLSESDHQHQVELGNHLKLFKDNPCEKIPPMSRLYSLMIQDSAKTEQTWLISQRLGFEDLPTDVQVMSSTVCSKNPLPRGGVAALIVDKGQKIHRKYKAYCFLPLRVYTKLPVHVNGMFELDSSRNNLLKGESFVKADSSSEKDGLIHIWNLLLMTHVIAPAYAELIEHAGRKIICNTEDIGSSKDQVQLFEELFPKDLENLHEEWLHLAEETFRYIGKKHLKVLPVVRPKENGYDISWHNPNSLSSLAFFDNLKSEEPIPPATAAAEEGGTETTPSLQSFLLEVGMNVLECSQELCQAFKRCGVGAEFINPQAVVTHISSQTVIASSLPAPLAKTAFKDLNTFSMLLEYCLSGTGISQPSQLSGLPFRLSNDGMLSEFTTNDGLYVTSHCNILSSLQDRFLHVNLVDFFIKWFKENESTEEAFTSGLFKRFNISEFSQHLGELLPKDWKGCNKHLEWTPEQNGHPSKAWLQDMWTFICSEITDDNLQSCLEPIQDWPLFPQQSGKLVPPSLVKTMVFFYTFQGSPSQLKQAEVLRKLLLPEVELNSMYYQKEEDVNEPPTDLIKLMETHSALPANQESIANVVKFMLDNGFETGKLSEIEEIEELLQYFQEGCETMSDESLQTIKMLPIFRLPSNETTDLQNATQYHTAEDYQMKMAESETWMKHMDCAFLEPRPLLTKIYKKLGITTITNVEIYLKYILPRFCLLSQEAQVKHLKNIEDVVLGQASKEEKKYIISELSSTPFLIDQTVNNFFDPANSVFEGILHEDKLLPNIMEPCKRILIKVGLNINVTQDLFVKFAVDIETRAKQITTKKELKDLTKMSELLTMLLDKYKERTIQYSKRSIVDSSFLQKIAHIKFLPSYPIEATYNDIYPAFAAFISYHGSVSYLHWKYIWSAAMLLPDWAIPDNRKLCVEKRCIKTSHDYLGIQTYLLDKVICHTQNVCGNMEKGNAVHKKDTMSKEKRESLQAVMKSILRFLNKIHDEHELEKIKGSLQSTSICIVDEGRVFVRADQLVFDMTKSHEQILRPYLYKTPRAIMEFENVFKLLGAQDTWSFDQLAGVLSAIKTGCGENSLDPNERITVVTAVREMFLLLHSGTKCEFSVTELYLPSTNFFLKNASHLYYTDPILRDKLQGQSTDKEFIIPLKQCGLGDFDEMRLIELLPEPFRLKNPVRYNEIQEKSCDSNEDCPAGPHCSYLEHIKRMMNSEEMTRVLLRLIQHQMVGKQPHKEVVSKIQTLQSFDNLACKTELKIGWYDSNGDMIAHQPYTSKAFFDKGTNVLYLDHSNWPSMQHTSHAFSQIAKGCNAFLDGLLDSEHVSYLQSALDSQSPNEMNRKLSESKIPEYGNETTGASRQDEYQLGAIVPSDIHYLLDHDPFNRFYKDEIVAYDGTLDKNTAPSSGKTIDVICARIVEGIDENEEAIGFVDRRFRIDIGEKEYVAVTVATLYKFMRHK